MPDKRYEMFGWDYQQINRLSQKEINWYVSFAQKTGGPVLELACGAGRLLIEIARQGFDCDGIDLSPNMLAIAENNVSALPMDISSRVRLHNMDMADFDLGRKFGLAIVADNSFRELVTMPQQESCLRCVYRHLRRGGKLLVTVRRFDPSRYQDGRREWGWSTPLRNPVSGEIVTRKVESELTEDGRRIRGAFLYKTTHADGRETLEKCGFEAPIMLKSDYISLFTKTGFQPHVFAGYESEKDDEQSPIMSFVCDKK